MVELEILELMISYPMVVPLVLERVQPEWLICPAAKDMLVAYQELEHAGYPLDFENVLLAFEDPSLKSLLVTLHENLRSTSQTAENRLRDLTLTMEKQKDAVRQQLLQRELQSIERTAEEKSELLLDIIRQRRLRQGLVEKEPESSEPASGVTENGQPSP